MCKKAKKKHKRGSIVGKNAQKCAKKQQKAYRAAEGAKMHQDAPLKQPKSTT